MLTLMACNKHTCGGSDTCVFPNKRKSNLFQYKSIIIIEGTGFKNRKSKKEKQNTFGELKETKIFNAFYI